MTPLGGGGRAQPYVDAMPVLHGVRWRESVKKEAPESFRRTVPGFVGRAGCRVPLWDRAALDAAVEVIRSRDLGVRKLGEYSGGAFQGLSQVGYEVGMSFASRSREARTDHAPR